MSTLIVFLLWTAGLAKPEKKMIKKGRNLYPADPIIPKTNDKDEKRLAFLDTWLYIGFITAFYLMKVIAEICLRNENKKRIITLPEIDSREGPSRIPTTKKIAVATFFEACIYVTMGIETLICTEAYLSDRNQPGFKWYNTIVMTPCFIGYFA